MNSIHSTQCSYLYKVTVLQMLLMSNILSRFSTKFLEKLLAIGELQDESLITIITERRRLKYLGVHCIVRLL